MIDTIVILFIIFLLMVMAFLIGLLVGTSQNFIEGGDDNDEM